MIQIPWRNYIDGDFTMAWKGSGVASPGAAQTFSAGAMVATQAPAGEFSINVATGQDASGAIQTAGDLPDANWTVTNADNYRHAPIAYTVAPGEPDWSAPYWFANGPVPPGSRPIRT